MQNAGQNAFQFAAKAGKPRHFGVPSPAPCAPPPFHMTFVSAIGVVQRSSSTGDEFFFFFSSLFLFLRIIVFSFSSSDARGPDFAYQLSW